MSTTVSARPGRLRSSRDVLRVLRLGRRGSTSRLAVHVVADSAPDGPRVGVIASRRVGSAPARNRAKRLLREAAARIDWPTTADIVLVARPGIVGADLWDVLEDLVGLTAGNA